MPAFQVKIQGLAGFQKALLKSPQESIKQMSRAVKKSVVDVQREATRAAPIDSGRLRGAFRARTMGLFGAVWNTAEYAEFVHEGTRPHKIRVKNRKVLASKKAGKVFGKEVNHPGTRAQPFMEEGLKRAQNRIDGNFAKATANIVKFLAKNN